MSRVALAAALVAAALWAEAAAACPAPHAGAAYTQRVDRALRSGTDLLGRALLAGEPTYARAAAQLQPLLYARGARGTRLTASGVYYLPFGRPAGPRGTSAVMLHVGDGSELIARRAGGPSVIVRAGGERFGACLARLATPRLADGWLPILQTRYGRYRQESFAARAGGGLASYVRVEGPRVSVGPIAASGVLYARWDGRRVTRIGAAAYDAARAGVVAYWQGRLAEGAQVEVPDPHVPDAMRALLVQELTQTWRYSVGNPYEEFSFPEGVDVAQVLDEWGFADVARSILRTSLTRPPNPYPNWKRGEKLLGWARHARLSEDAAGLRAATPVLRGYVAALERQLEPRGLLRRERYSSDIEDEVYGLHTNAVVWQGLRELAAAWDAAGRPADARRARLLAARLERGLRRAVAASQRRLPDGTLFLPVRLLDREPAYASLTQERAGSYWNLVAPYALASGLFAPQSPQARGALAYMRRHGSRLLGLVRAGAYALYGRDVRFPVSGTDQVYGINASRFLADMGQADELVLSLYGQLGAGMTRGTFIAGEGATVAPLSGERYRSMYLPPNGAANAAFLETLRLLLVHETPTGLELVPSTPRAWLRPGKRIVVRRLPTSYGPISFSLTATHLSLDVPPRTPGTLVLRLRRPGSTRTVDLSGRTGHVELDLVG